MGIDHPPRLRDLEVGDDVRIIAAVGTAHVEAPDAARLEFELAGGGLETARSPPLVEVPGVGPGLPDQFAAGFKVAGDNDLAVGGRSGGFIWHVYSLSFGVPSNSRRDGPGFPPIIGGNAPPTWKHP